MRLRRSGARAERTRRPPRGAALAVSALLLAPAVLVAAPAEAQTVTVATWRELDPVISPPARYAAGVATDPAGGEVVVFGGWGGSYLGDTWTWNGATWVERPTPIAPSNRHGAAMTGDPASGGVVLFGGYRFGSNLDDTWLWDGANWAEHPTPLGAPSPRRHAAMAYSPANGGVLLFGGTNGSTLNDTWLWTGSTWLEVTPDPGDPNPPGRSSGRMAFDPASGGVILFGGDGADNGTWLWDGLGWVELDPATSPSARGGHGIAYDPVRQEVLIFGGSGLDDTWSWDGLSGTWAERDPADFPSARGYGAMAFHPPTGEVIYFGGLGSTTYGDTWAYGAEAEPPGVPLDYPSGDSECASADNILRGQVGGAFASLGVADSGDGTAVCVAADDGFSHLGGKLVLDGVPGTPVETDGDATACILDASNERVHGGALAGQPFTVDVTPLPDGDPDLAWVCVQALGVGVRIVLTTSGGGTGTEFLPDALTPPPGGYAEEAWPVAGQPSADCKAAGTGTKTRLLNLRVGASDRVAAYTWQESLTKAHVCVRGNTTSGSAGGRFTVDGAGVPATVTPVFTLAPCPFPMLTRDNFPSFGIWTSDPEEGAPPASACVEVANTVTVGATVNSPGSVVDFQEDAA